MHFVTLRGPAAVSDTSTSEEVIDPAVLQKSDGREADFEGDTFADYIEDSRLTARGISGGGIKLVFDPSKKKLQVETTYNTETPLSEEELVALIDFTVGQWADGFGSSFGVTVGLAPKEETSVSVWNFKDTYQLTTSWFEETRAFTWVNGREPSVVFV